MADKFFVVFKLLAYFRNSGICFFPARKVRLFKFFDFFIATLTILSELIQSRLVSFQLFAHGHLFAQTGLLKLPHRILDGAFGFHAGFSFIAQPIHFRLLPSSGRKLF